MEAWWHGLPAYTLGRSRLGDQLMTFGSPVHRLFSDVMEVHALEVLHDLTKAHFRQCTYQGMLVTGQFFVELT